MSDPTATGAGDSRYLVPCPICLTEIDWSTVKPSTVDKSGGRVVPIVFPPGASTYQRRQAELTAVVECPNSTGRAAHTLPFEYGRYGRPIVIGLVGKTSSGKTHLLSALVKALEDKTGVYPLGVLNCVPVEESRHRRFLDERVNPLFVQGRAIHGTTDGIEMYADAFVLTTLRECGRSTVVIALFDVSGGDLAMVTDHRRFLYVADGLLFVADATALDSHEGTVTGDLAFGAVLDLLGKIGRESDMVASIALTKADRLRFDDPIDYWLRQPVDLAPSAIRAESRDIFAYLRSRGGDSWLRPLLACRTTTLHAVSATGGSSVPDPESDGDEVREVRADIFPRGVAPQRVLGPLAALLVMLGALPLAAPRDVRIDAGGF